MPLPETDRAIVKFLEYVDEPLVARVFNKDRQACCEAGKRDASTVENAIAVLANWNNNTNEAPQHFDAVFALAKSICENLGYVVEPEPEHSDVVNYAAACIAHALDEEAKKNCGNCRRAKNCSIPLRSGLTNCARCKVRCSEWKVQA